MQKLDGSERGDDEVCLLSVRYAQIPTIVGTRARWRRQPQSNPKSIGKSVDSSRMSELVEITDGRADT